MKHRSPLVQILLLIVLGHASLIAPIAVSAASCVIVKSTYKVGELMDLYGHYSDFGDPGTVAIDFTRPADGATRSYVADNIADGSWMTNVTFTSSADIGTWQVHIVVTQTSGISTCDDQFKVVAASAPAAPDTATAGVDSGGPTSRSTPPITWLVLGLLTFVVAAVRPVRRRHRG